MKSKEVGENTQKKASEFVTVGDVKLPVALWSRVNTYKSNQRVQGRKMKMPEVSAELIEKGLNAEGI